MTEGVVTWLQVCLLCIYCVMCEWEEACLSLSLLFTVSVFVARRPVWWFLRAENELRVSEASFLLSAEIYELPTDREPRTDSNCCVSV